MLISQCTELLQHKGGSFKCRKSEMLLKVKGILSLFLILLSWLCIFILNVNKDFQFDSYRHYLE